jgi:hypothetical protein
MRFSMAYVFAATIAFLCFDAFSDEGTRGNTEYHQIIDGDPESYEAFERSFFASESPILKLAKHSSLCSLDLQNSEHMAIRNTYFAQKREKKHRYITTHMPCSILEAITKNNPPPIDATQLYLFEGMSSSRDGSIKFLRSAHELILKQGNLSKKNVATLADYLGIQGIISNIYDSGMNRSTYPFVTFSTIDTAPGKITLAPKHRLISAYSSDSGIFIYEREKTSSDDVPWQPLDVKRHSKSLSLLQIGAKSAALDSIILNNQPEVAGAYFLENVAFSLNIEFSLNNFGYPLLISNWYEPSTAGHIVTIIDADTLRKDGNWLYFTEAFFMSTTASDQPTLNVATNLPKLIIKRKQQVSCKREKINTLAISSVPPGAKDKWINMDPKFKEINNSNDKAFAMIVCSSQSLLRDPSGIIANLEKLYFSDLFNVDNYSTSAARLIFEYANYAAK